MNHRKVLLIIFLFHLTGLLKAQKYYELLQQPHPNRQEVISAYNEYYRTHEFVKTEKTRAYKNWLKLYQHRFHPDGTPLQTTDNSASLKQINLVNSSPNARIAASNKPWKPVPLAVDRRECYAIGQNGVVRAVAMHPTQTSIVLASGLGGGLWRSTDNGSTWEDVLTDLPLIGMINRIVFAPSNPTIVYAALATGVIKSTDAGKTWLQTSLNWTVYFPNVDFAGDDYRSEFMYVDVHPTNPNIIIATDCSPADLDSKISRSTDGGLTWTSGVSFAYKNYVHDLKFHPTNGNIVYALVTKGDNTNFYRSTDGGLTFDAPTKGFPNDYFNTKEERRGKLAVSPMTPDVLYLYYQDAALGATFYTSTDKGATLSKVCCGASSEFMNKSAADRDFFGENMSAVQIRWATTLAASPTQANVVYAATNTRPRVSKDGMKTWYWDGNFAPLSEQPLSNISNAAPDQCRSYIHGDIQDVAINGNKIWIANDGGLSFSNDGGKNFVERADGMPVNTILGFDISHRNNIQTIALDHNGVLVRDDKLYNGKWKPFGGGDASGASINKIDDTWLYAIPSSGALIKRPSTSLHGHPNYFSIGNIDIGSAYTSGYRNVQTHPNQYYTLVTTAREKDAYTPAGVYRSHDNAKSWELIKKFKGNKYWYGDVRVSFADSKTIFAIESSEAGAFLWKTNDDGQTWTDVYPHNANRDQLRAVRVALSDTDPNKVWLATNSRDAVTEQVMYSADGGATWINYSQGLPSFKIYSMEYQRGSKGGIYVGTDYGVYYRDATMTSWVLHGTQLPGIAPTYMHIDYSNDKIFIGTYRGIWENELHETGIIKSQITADKNTVQLGCDKVQFACFSALKIDAKTRWEWTFEGGTPSSSTLERPLIQYNQLGKYAVTLKVSNGTNSAVQTLANFITVKETECTVSCVAGKSANLSTLEDVVVLSGIPNLDSTNTLTMMGWVKPSKIQADYTGLLMTSRGYVGMFLKNQQNEVGYMWNGNNWWLNTGATLPNNVWSHVALVIQPDSSLIFVNGVKYGFAATNVPVSLSNIEWQLGTDRFETGVGSRNFTGEMDEIRIYNRSLTASEIKAAMNTIPSKIPQDLVAYYQFNETNNSIAYDKVTRQVINVPQKLPSTVTVACASKNVLLQPKAFLQAAYNNTTGLMSDTLRKIGVLPLVSPYNAAESTTKIILANNEVVDWISIELRSRTNPKNVLHKKSALLIRNGNIISADGTPTLAFEEVAADSFFIAIRHRNHLGVMTASAVLLNNTAPTVVDFSSPSLTTYKATSNGIAQLTLKGVRMLWAGSNPLAGEVKYIGNGNNVERIYQSIINTTDNLFKLSSFVKKNAYQVEDINLDGTINYITDTVRLLSVVLNHPNNIFGLDIFYFTEQLP